MGITQAQAKTTSTNTNQTTAPANSANRYSANCYTANRYTGNFNHAHHGIALIILIFRFYMLQHTYCNVLTFIPPIPKPPPGIPPALRPLIFYNFLNLTA
jgi:hypothetical protein